MTATLQLGTRGSLLALWQARWVQDGLEAAHPGLGVGVRTFHTRGDRVLDRPLASIGGKALFTREIDDALLGKDIDLAVHSLKDLPFSLPAGLCLAAVPLRGDPRDALVSDGCPLADLPDGATIGTSSLRRRAQLLSLRADLRIRDLRGNVDTRLRKLDAGTFAGIVLSAAGLERLGFRDRISERIDPVTLLPAVGQGAVAIVARDDDPATLERCRALEHPPSRVAVDAERALLETLEGNCQVPLGGLATLDGDRLILDGLVAAPDGTEVVRDRVCGSPAEPRALGRELGLRLRAQGAERLLDRIGTDGA